MSNERDYLSEYFEAKGVSPGEFEALKRFGDYEELSDGTLMRMEGTKEFRIYCEDSGWLRGRNGGRGVLVTSGFCRVLSEAHDRVVEKQKKDPNYLVRLHEKFKTWTLSFPEDQIAFNHARSGQFQGHLAQRRRLNEKAEETL